MKPGPFVDHHHHRDASRAKSTAIPSHTKKKEKVRPVQRYGPRAWEPTVCLDSNSISPTHNVGGINETVRGLRQAQRTVRPHDIGFDG